MSLVSYKTKSKKKPSKDIANVLKSPKKSGSIALSNIVRDNS
jgi:hypothetical protein